MPKTRRDSPVSFEKSRKSPLHCCSSLSRESKLPNPSATDEDVKEWEDARCPVCMDHPHNAVLLICSSYHKNCRPYMCDTSYRHSNCLDQFRKSFPEASTEIRGECNQDDEKSQGIVASELFSSMHKLQQKLVCPLCRGQISGWVVVDSARGLMNTKSRNCASETCDFTGSYSDLRKHARSEHPKVRPTEADPERQRSWRHLERQRNIGDVLSSLQTSYGDDVHNEAIIPMGDRGLITIFFLFRVLQPSTSPRRSSGSGTSRLQTRAQTSARRAARLLWGEREDSETVSNTLEDDESSDGGYMTWRRRVRRRLSTPEDET